MCEKRRVQKFWPALVTAGALSVSTWTGAQARPFGLLLGGGFHHIGGLGGFHQFGGFGGGFRPGFGGGFHGRTFGVRQAGLGYGGFGSAGGSRWHGGSGRGRYWGAYGAAAAIGVVGAYSSGYPGADTDNGRYSSYGYYGDPAYGY
jgi:U1 small nuclear ribonucleoprotein